MKQFLFYQHNVQQFFIRHLDKFDGVIVPLSIATSFPDGTHGFLRALFSKDQTKQFLIDPRSPLFQKAWDRANVREPHKKMAETYGPPISTNGLSTRLSTNDLTDTALSSMTEAQLVYQHSFRTHQQEQKKIAKYKKLLGVEEMPTIANPQLWVPPYFEFQLVGDEWYVASLKCVRFACDLDFIDVASIRPVVHCANIGETKNWDDLTGELSKLGVSSVFLYPNEFREHDEDKTSIVAYCDAVKAFANAGIIPHSLHGGYFAATLRKIGLQGFGNGVGYGEWRNSGYHRGGTAEKRIYIPRLHRFLEPARAQALLNSVPDYFGTDSDLLAECLESQRPLIAVSLEEALDHFMECRRREIDFIGENSAETIAEELSTTIDVLSGLDVLGKPYVGSLNVWRNVIAGWQ